MRLKSGIWVSAYLRRCQVEGAFAAIRRRGADEAGAIFIKLNRLDGTAELFTPAPQAAFDEARPSGLLASIVEAGSRAGISYVRRTVGRAEAAALLCRIADRSSSL